MFQRASIVVLDDRHNDEVDAGFRLQVLASPRIVSTVEDIVIEFGNARYQGVLDRYIAGGQVSHEELAQVWRNTTQPGCCDAPMYEQFLKAVRERNRGLAPSARLRVLAADPAIDWGKVRSGAEWEAYLYQRDTFAADLMEREVLARHRKALVIMGAGHFYRDDPMSPENITTLIEAQYPGSVYVIAAVGGSGALYEALAAQMGTEDVPGFADLRRTSAGALLANTYFPGSYGRVLSGKVTDATNQRFPGRRLAQIADGVVNLGPERPAAAVHPLSAADAGYADELRRRVQMVRGNAGH